MFPISVEGRIEIQTDLNNPKMVDNLFKNIKDTLERENATDIYRQGDRMIFRVGIIPWWTTKLSSLSSGEFKVVGDNPGFLEYKASAFKPLVWLLFLVWLFLFYRQADLITAIPTVVVGLGVFASVNYFLAYIQIRSVAKNIAATRQVKH